MQTDIITDYFIPGIWNQIDRGGLHPLSSPGIGGAVERWDDGKVLPAEEALWSTSYVRDYCGDIIYKDGEIERILTDNGYAVPDSAGGYDYYYYVKDWQGNVRAVIDEVLSLRYAHVVDRQRSALQVRLQGARPHQRPRHVRLPRPPLRPYRSTFHHDGRALRERPLHLSLCILRRKPYPLRRSDRKRLERGKRDTIEIL